MIEEDLIKLGFNKNEALIYITIYKAGQITPHNVSISTGINRTTVYANAKSLIKKGFITEDIAGNNRKYFVAKPPVFIAKYFEKNKKEVDEKVDLAKKVIESLQKEEKSKYYSLPKIRFIPEHQIKDFLFDQTLYWEASMKRVKDYTWWGFQDVDFPDKYSEWIDWYWKRADSVFNLKLISSHSDNKNFLDLLERHKERRLLMPWTEKADFSSTLWVHGEYIVMLVLKQKPNYLIEIHDKLLSENLRELFKKIWEKEIETKNRPKAI